MNRNFTNIYFLSFFQVENSTCICIEIGSNPIRIPFFLIWLEKIKGESVADVFTFIAKVRQDNNQTWLQKTSKRLIVILGANIKLLEKIGSKSRKRCWYAKKGLEELWGADIILMVSMVGGWDSLFRLISNQVETFNPSKF